MSLTIRKIQAWSGELPDRPGGAAGKLALLANAGADLSYVFTRPHPTEPETSRIYLAPIIGAEQTRAASNAGLAPTSDVSLICVEGVNRIGIAYEIMARLAVAGLNLYGLSVSTLGNRFAAYLAFDNPDTATSAVQVLANLIDIPDSPMP